MSFSRPWWLPVGFAACVILLWAWRRHDARQHAALARFVSAHLREQLTQSISTGRRRVQRGLTLAALALLFAALAGPLAGYRWETISRRGNEIVFAIDTSRSMSAPDVKPSRLARAKLAIDDFIDLLDGDAVGIVAFAGSAFLVCPITLDYGAFHESLSAVDTNTIPRGGTNISSAVREAQSALRRRPGSDRILILVTDGEDLEGSALDAARAAKQEDGLRIFTVGVGTAGGELIPLPPDQGGGFVKDAGGALVKSRLDEPALKAIAAATGGFYVPLGTQGEGLETIFKSVLGPMAKHDLASRQQKIYTPRYQWPLAASLSALLTSLLIGTRRRRTRPAAAAAAVRGMTPVCLLLCMLLGGAATHAAAENAAPAATPSPGTHEKPVEDYNQGTAAYRAGHFPQAAQAFKQSINHAPSDDASRLADQEDAYYNLGNTLYRTGQQTERSAPQQTLKEWTDAVKAYETALQLRADDADSKYNRDLVKRKIAALQQQQNQNQKQDQGKGQSQNKNQGQDEKQGPQQNQGQNPQQAKASAQQQNQPPESPPKSAQNNDAGPAPQPPQSNSNGSKGGQPPQPQNAAQSKPPAANADPEDSDKSGAAQNSRAEDSRTADDQHLPGQMSREEARELLDSVKGDERRPPGVPMARQQDPYDPPDKPFKNW